MTHITPHNAPASPTTSSTPADRATITFVLDEDARVVQPTHERGAHVADALQRRGVTDTRAVRTLLEAVRDEGPSGGGDRPDTNGEHAATDAYRVTTDPVDVDGCRRTIVSLVPRTADPLEFDEACSICCDVDGAIVDVSPKALRVLGYEDDHDPPRGLADIDPLFTSGTWEAAKRACSASRLTRRRVVLRSRSGTLAASTLELRRLRVDGRDLYCFAGLERYGSPSTANDLRELIEALTPVASPDYYRSLCLTLSGITGMNLVCMTRVSPAASADRGNGSWIDDAIARPLAAIDGGRSVELPTYPLRDTPCAEAVRAALQCVPDGVIERFPSDEMLRELDARSYVGACLYDGRGRPIGHLFGLSPRPMRDPERTQLAFRLAAERAGAELERRTMLEALRESEGLHRRLVESATDAVVVYREGRILFANDAARKLHNVRSAADLVGRREAEFIPGSSADVVNERNEGVRRDPKSTWLIEHDVRRTDGAIRRVESTATAVQYEGRPALQVIMRDVTERRRAEQMLDRFFDLSFNMLAVVGEDLAIERVNERFCTLMGRDADSIEGLPITDLLPVGAAESFAEALREAFTSDGPSWLDLDIADAHGRNHAMRWMIHADDHDRRAFLSGSDRSERRALEAKLRQADRLQTIGLLASGLAHDFGNLLTAIAGHVHAAEHDIPHDHPTAETLGALDEVIEQAQSLTESLLTLGRCNDPCTRRTTFEDLLLGMEPLLRGLLRDGVRLELDLHAERARPVDIDAGQFRQVLINLVVNARDAMPEGGEVRIRVNNQPDQPATRATISVEDSGVGMSEELAERIFEPFFTTKARRKGTGLGLALAQAIVQGHHGELTVESSPERGSAFRIALPVASGDGVQPAQRPNRPATQVPEGACAVLHYPDGHGRELVASLLEEVGLTVLMARGAERSPPHDLAVVHATTVATLDASTPAVIIGGPEVEARHRPDTGVSRVVLPMPFALDDLADAVAEALETPPASHGVSEEWA